MKWKKIVPVMCWVGFIWMILGLGNLAAAQNQKTFTPAELAKNNGQNRARAYVAVNGVVYDLTDVPEWAQGRHYCSGAIAGKDITFVWNLVPASHKNPKFLKRFPVVGKLVSSQPQRGNSTTPSPAAPGEVSLWKILLEGLAIAIGITLIWLAIRYRRNRV